MREERRGTGQPGFHRATKVDALRSMLATRRIIAGAAGIVLSVALAACGGSNGSGVTSGAIPTAQSMAEVAAAASAAASTSVPLATSLKMNVTSIQSDTQTDRFIVKYKLGTPEHDATAAVESRLDRFAGAFPSKAHHQRRMGVGSDIVKTERKLNAAEAKAFMRAIATDPNVEYVEPDSEMHAMMMPNDPQYITQWYMRSNLTPRYSSPESVQRVPGI